MKPDDLTFEETGERSRKAHYVSQSGWGVFPDEAHAGDVIKPADHSILPSTRMVLKPVEGESCDFCNHETSVAERESSAITKAADEGERVVVAFTDDEGERREGVVEGKRRMPWGLYVEVDGERRAIDSYDEIVEAPFPDDVGTINADYKVERPDTTVEAHTCHACIEEAPVVGRDVLDLSPDDVYVNNQEGGA